MISVLAVLTLRICNLTVSSCLSWGSVQGVSWGSFFSILAIFNILIFILHIRDFPSILSHTAFYWERTVSVCIMTLYSVFLFTPSVWRALYLAGHLYLEGHIYLEGHLYLKTYICLEGSSLVYGLDHPDTSIPAASKMAQLIFRDQNYVSSAIHFVCVYTPCLYTRYT